MGKDKKTSRGVEVKPLMGQFADVQEEKQVKINILPNAMIFLQLFFTVVAVATDEPKYSLNLITR